MNGNEEYSCFFTENADAVRGYLVKHNGTGSPLEDRVRDAMELTCKEAAITLSKAAAHLMGLVTTHKEKNHVTSCMRKVFHLIREEYATPEEKKLKWSDPVVLVLCKYANAGDPVCKRALKKYTKKEE